MPKSLNSRPYPDFLTPPNGNSAAVIQRPLMTVIPASIWAATFLARSISLLITDEPKR